RPPPDLVSDLTAKVTVLRLGAFVTNVPLVVSLVVPKRLFGVRGGKKAYEARLRSASILQAEIDALAAAPATHGPPGAGAAEPGGAAAPGGPGQPVETSTRSAASEATTPAGPGQPVEMATRSAARRATTLAGPNQPDRRAGP